MPAKIPYRRHPRPHPDRPGADRQPVRPRRARPHGAAGDPAPKPTPLTRTAGSRVRIPTGPAPIGNRPGCSATAVQAVEISADRTAGIRVRIPTGPAPIGNRLGPRAGDGTAPADSGPHAEHAVRNRRRIAARWTGLRWRQAWTEGRGWAPPASASASRPARRQSGSRPGSGARNRTAPSVTPWQSRCRPPAPAASGDTSRPARRRSAIGSAPGPATAPRPPTPVPTPNTQSGTAAGSRHAGVVWHGGGLGSRGAGGRQQARRWAGQCAAAVQAAGSGRGVSAPRPQSRCTFLLAIGRPEAIPNPGRGLPVPCGSRAGSTA